MSGRPKRCRLAHAFLRIYSCKRLKLARLLGRPDVGVFLTLAQAPALKFWWPAAQVACEQPTGVASTQAWGAATVYHHGGGVCGGERGLRTRTVYRRGKDSV